MDQAKEMFAKHEIQGVISTETSIWVSTGLSAVFTTGGSEIYYGINKNRPDLKEELDRVMRAMEMINPFIPMIFINSILQPSLLRSFPVMSRSG